MRVPEIIRKELVNASRVAFGDIAIKLFGSRLNDNARGGDFDLAVMTNMDKDKFLKAKVKFFKYLLMKDLDLPVDIVLYGRADELLKSEIDKGVRLV